MTARVLCVTAFSSRSRSIVRVAESMSTKTGLAPTSRTTLLVATHERGVVITSSPCPTPAIRSAISIVQVPELNARTGRPPKYSESLASNAFTWGPDVIQPERSTSDTPAIVSSSIDGRVNGRNGSTGLGGMATAGDGISGTMLRIDGDSSRLVAEKIMRRAGRQDVEMELRIVDQRLRVPDPGDREQPAGACPFPPEFRVVDERRPERVGAQELCLELVLVVHEPHRAARVVGEVVEEPVVMVDAVPGPDHRSRDERDIPRAAGV